MAQSSTNKKVLIVDTSQAEQSINKLKLQVKQLTTAYEKSDQRTLESKVIKDKLTNATNQLTAATKRETTTVNTEANAHANSTKAIQLRINKLREEMQVMDMSSAEYKTATSNMMGMNASMQEGARSTGLAATSAMEFGRVVSDAPYGIRGMANNVSQLTSLLFQGARATDAATGKMIGLSGSIKGMWTAMMGPLGIMIAIQAVIAAIDFFAGSTKKADEETEKLSESVSSLAEDLKNLGLSQWEVNKRIEDYIVLRKIKTNLDTKEAKNSERLGEINKELVQIDKDKALAIKEVAYNQNQLNKFTKEQQDAGEGAKFAIGVKAWGKVVDKAMVKSKTLFNEERTLLGDSIKEWDDYNNKKDEVLLSDKETLAGYQRQKAELQLLQKNISTTSEKYDEYAESIRLVQVEIDRITTPDDKGSKGKGKAKDFELQESKILDLIKKSLREQELLLATSNKEKLLLNQQYQEEDLLAVYNLEQEKNKVKLNAYLNSGASPAQKLAAQALFDEKEKQALIDHEAALTAIHKENAIEVSQFDKVLKDEITQSTLSAELNATEAHLDLMSELLNEKDPNSLALLQENQRAVWEVEDQLFEEDLERKREKLEMDGYSELEIQTIIDDEKYAYSAQRASDEVKLEKDTIDAKMALQMEYISFVRGIGQVLSNLGKKQKALAIVGLALEKGSAIADIIVKTQASNAKVGLGYAAAQAQSYAQLGPIGGLAGALAMAAAGAATLVKNNVTAGVSIAKIAATTLTSKSLGGGSSGGGGGGGATPTPSFTPTFDVVGNSGQNQLAEGISNQINQPVQAYVVYEDIQEAGEINDNAVESSGI
tara:strand:+ start:700 stop:3183 length:2484 start_codon:yes stop_codon:yes gene_type:complete